MEKAMKLVVFLFLLLLFALFALLGQVFYILCCRRRCGRDSPTTDSEIAAGAGGPSSKWIIPHLRCWKNNSRVEPAAAPAENAVEEKGEEDDGDAVIWRAMCYGPSRVLYTIKEEEREGSEAEVEVVVVDGEDEDDMDFSTPCASPEFYSPAPSPHCFDAVERGGDL